MRNTIFDETSWPNDNAMDHLGTQHPWGVVLVEARFDLLLYSLGEIELSSCIVIISNSNMVG